MLPWRTGLTEKVFGAAPGTALPTIGSRYNTVPRRATVRRCRYTKGIDQRDPKDDLHDLSSDGSDERSGASRLNPGVGKGF